MQGHKSAHNRSATHSKTLLKTLLPTAAGINTHPAGPLRAAQHRTRVGDSSQAPTLLLATQTSMVPNKHRLPTTVTPLTHKSLSVTVAKTTPRSNAAVRTAHDARQLTRVQGPQDDETGDGILNERLKPREVVEGAQSVLGRSLEPPPRRAESCRSTACIWRLVSLADTMVATTPMTISCRGQQQQQQQQQQEHTREH